MQICIFVKNSVFKYEFLWLFIYPWKTLHINVFQTNNLHRLQALLHLLPPICITMTSVGQATSALTTDIKV